MAAKTVGLAELRVMADYFINADFPYFTELHEAFQLLKLTGCRIQEIFEIYRWRRLEGNTFELIPQKKNNPRYIILDDTFLSFQTAVDNQYAPFLGRTYSQLQGIFNKINPYGKLYSGGKEITNYFFRYLYVRELFETGLTLSEIADHMGYGSTTAVNNYLNADLGSTIEVPVAPSDPLPPIHLDILTVPTQIFSSNSGASFINPLISPTFSIIVKATIVTYAQIQLIGSQDYTLGFLWPHVTLQMWGARLRASFTLRKDFITQILSFRTDKLFAKPYTIIFTVDYSQQDPANPLNCLFFGKIYVNGLLEITFFRSILKITLPMKHYLNIGSYANSPSSFISSGGGSVDFLYMYNRLLSSEELNLFSSL